VWGRYPEEVVKKKGGTKFNNGIKIPYYLEVISQERPADTNRTKKTVKMRRKGMCSKINLQAEKKREKKLRNCL